MHFIEHIIEPQRLLLAWQTSDEKHRTRYIVAELNRVGEEITLTYLPETKDFIEAKELGFKSYPAFLNINVTHYNVLDTFMRRLPPRTRGDFSQYLEGLRLKPNIEISDFGLLGYSGAKLLSDGFSLIHPFDNISSACELLLEASGYRHIHNPILLNLDDPVSFSAEEVNEVTQEPAICMNVNGNPIGYVNKGLVSTFTNWLKKSRITDAWIEKINGSSERPVVYIYVKVSST